MPETSYPAVDLQDSRAKAEFKAFSSGCYKIVVLQCFTKLLNLSLGVLKILWFC